MGTLAGDVRVITAGRRAAGTTAAPRATAGGDACTRTARSVHARADLRDFALSRAFAFSRGFLRSRASDVRGRNGAQ